ncbi:unnamed protein product [Cyprideis torosa]|uniref:Uncharacterized protein n=1 Tax=Cyprideis torosa TaxID=163714 RepID=A0A7R8W9W7_9CRUS|nr:unnamed protein product [Cyprideis torosa]CAG0885289.1 unnamed protein product [Cyprideis torosa]
MRRPFCPPSMFKGSRWFQLILVLFLILIIATFFISDEERYLPRPILHNESGVLIRSYLTEASPETWLEMYRNRSKLHLNDLDCKANGVLQLRNKCWKPRVPCLGDINLIPIVIPITNHLISGKYFCNLELMKRLTNSRPLIYSLGSNDEWDFEEFMYNYFDQMADIHTFSIERAGKHKPHWLSYHRIAIGSEKNLTQLHQELGYAGKPIHLLKVDIEGFEQLVLADLFGPDGKTCMLEIWHFNLETHWDINYMFGGYPGLPYKMELQAQHERQLSEVCGLEKFAHDGLLGIFEHAYIKVAWKDVLRQISQETRES